MILIWSGLIEPENEENMKDHRVNCPANGGARCTCGFVEEQIRLRETMTRHGYSLEAIVNRMKREIKRDVKAGRVPRTVKSFSELHDHVDANEYGGFCEDDGDSKGWDPSDEKDMEFMNAAQDAIHQWIVKNGGVPYV